MRTDGGPPIPGGGPGTAGGRAGRDLSAAIVVSLVIGASVVASLLTVRVLYAGIVVLAVAIGVHEIVTAFRGRGWALPVVPLVVGGCLTEAATWRYGVNGLAAGAGATVLAAAGWRLATGRSGWGRDTAAAAFVTAYVPLLAGCVVLLAVPSDGARRSLAFAITTVCSDVGAYAVGVLAGRHLLAPTISPKKTWEGFAGSVVACTIAGALLLPLFFGAQRWQGVLFGIAVAIAATVGDLAESLLKRRLGVKDMGRLLPGHGGVMDRADSLLPAALVTLVLLAVFAPSH